MSSLFELLSQFHVTCSVCDERPRSQPSEIWLIQFHKQLEKQGISLPER